MADLDREVHRELIATCEEKIKFAEMRDMGVRGLLIYCSDWAAI